MANNDESKHNKFNNNNNNNQDDSIPDNFDAKSYNLSGKIMLCAIVFLFFIVIVMLCLHIYARWYLLRARRRHLRRNRLRRRTQLIFYTDSPTAAISSTTRGLDASAIASLPLFLYDPNTHPEITSECAVCLSEFESGETGRVLPKCNHAFHTECIDMWFISHSTCPLCRAPVEPTQTRSELGFNVFGSEPGSSSGMGLEENRTGREICSSSVGSRRKPSFVGVSIEIPSRNEDFGCDSPSTQSSFRSPMSRMLSLKRILRREKKGSVSPSSCGGGCSSAAELDVERGGRDETQ